MYEKYIKRLIDLFLSICGLIILFPVFVLLTLAITLDDPGTPFFSQKRIGKNRDGKISYFYIYKFRSMKKNAPRDVPTHMFLNPNQYITRVGKLLRRISLDELPQIINILKGEMSFIGPRPALWNQYDLYAEREKYGANDVTPGLSGWAQVNGRDELEIKEKAKLDGEYAKNITFKMDAACFLITITNVLNGKGIAMGNDGGMSTRKDEDKME